MSPFNSRPFQSWLLAAITFGVLALASDFLWTRVVIPGATTSGASKIDHLLSENGSEVPIFGDSTAHDDYVPELLGDDYFNCSTPAVCYDVWNVLLQIEVKKHKRTPIMFGMSAGNDNVGAGDPNNYVPFARRSEIRHMLDRFGMMEWRYWVPGLRYFGRYDYYLRDYLSARLSRTKKTVRGYTFDSMPQRFDRQTLEEIIKKREKEGYGFHPFPDQVSLFLDIIKNTPQRTFIIVFSPLHPAASAHFKNQEGFERHLAKLRSLPNVVVLDYTRMEFPEEFFGDTLHLNQTGAAEFSRRLAGQLRSIRAAKVPVTQNPAGGNH
jgi:hypothetical protein